MRVWRLVCLAAIALAVLPAVAQATETRYSLANGCYSLRSHESGRYVARQSNGTYAATASVPGGAEPFRMKASALGRYLLYDKGQYLAQGADGIVAGRSPGPGTDWRVDNAGPARFSIALHRSNRVIASSAKGGLGLRARSAAAGTDGFSFERASGCAQFPEANTAARGTPSKGKFSFANVKGTIDAHAHWMAFEFIGGDFHCGRPWSPYGIAVALPDCASIQGPAGTVAPVQNFLDYGDPVHPHDTVGYPTFKDWPSYSGLSYEGTYWKWLERSWQAGLRVVVNQLVENHAICEILFPPPRRRNSCDEMDSARLQRNQLYALQNYIDAQYGGPGKGFLRIVTDPFAARKVVNQGKIAVVMGMETSLLFGCGETNDVPHCDKAKVDRGLKEFKDLGVRSFFVVHKFDNAFGGTKMDGGPVGAIVNGGQRYESGHFWDIKTCTTKDDDNGQIAAGSSGIANLLHNTPFAAFLKDAAPVYPPGPQCNTRGLTKLGDYVMNRLMDNKLIIELDHMDAKARNETLALLEARKYSGVISAHSWASPFNFPRIYKLGGFITPSAHNSASFAKEWQEDRRMRDKRFYFGFGYGSDMNGLATQGAPLPSKPVPYPFKALDPKVTFDRQVTGKRTFDYNKDGVAQYGLYADWLKNISQLGGSQISKDMNRGAEAYLEMWERSTGIRATNCRVSRTRLGQKGFGRIRLGLTWQKLLQRAGQPSNRPNNLFRWCVKKSKGGVTAALDKKGKSYLVASTARRHRSGRIHPGSKAKLLKGKARKRKGGVWVGRRRKSGTRVFLVSKGRVKVVGAATRSLVKRKTTLRKLLRAAAKRRGISDLSPGGSSAAASVRISRAALLAQETAVEAATPFALCNLSSLPE